MAQLSAREIAQYQSEGWVIPQPPPTRTWKKVAVIGSGPASLLPP